MKNILTNRLVCKIRENSKNNFLNPKSFARPTDRTPKRFRLLIKTETLENLEPENDLTFNIFYQLLIKTAANGLG